MIALGRPGAGLGERFLNARGGFAWWYADIIDPAGDGLVLIWAYGLPFLPGYAASARRGDAPQARSRPSINLVTYRRGKPDFYLLQEYAAVAASAERRVRSADPEAGSAGGVVLRFGRSRFSSWAESGRRRVEAQLDCAVPGSKHRLSGTISLDGVARAGGSAAADHEDGEMSRMHEWTPLTGPAAGRAALRHGSREINIAGRGYHDRNGGAAALHELGIGRWIWARFPLDGREAILYLLWPESGGDPACILTQISSDGRTNTDERITIALADERRGWIGPRLPHRITVRRSGQLWGELRVTSVADRGPFYLRFQARIELPSGESALGWGELCEPHRVDLPLQRPLVRMRVHHDTGSNSVWLPLFSGPRQGRIRRLLGCFAARLR